MGLTCAPPYPTPGCPKSWFLPFFTHSIPLIPPWRLLDLAVEEKIIDRSGSWFSYGDERIGQGRENVKQFLKDNTQIALEIEDKIRAAHGLEFDMPEGKGGSEGDDDADILEA